MATFARTINVEMDWLAEDCFEIRGQLDDTVHSVTARLELSFPDFTILNASGEITRMPYPGYCQGAYAVVEKLIGEKIGRGFRKRLSDLLNGAESCNHLHTLVLEMSVCAFQMNYYAARRKPEVAANFDAAVSDQGKRRTLVLASLPHLRNACYLFSEKADALFERPVNADEPRSENAGD
jgi:hypothetical protein